jgi:hypothetical protein|tara:strand:+ start:3045 stop:3374 length:330 start_codon:yes stop_codon:yes gene_type:complete
MNEPSIYIVTLVTGDEVITNVQKHIEPVNGVDTEVCYKLMYPFSISDAGEGKIELTPWKKYSPEAQFLIGYDHILNMCVPWPTVTKEYEKAVSNFNKILLDMSKNDELV